jgi:radical SAM protein with 4Fe4S-binding SPASM domain
MKKWNIGWGTTSLCNMKCKFCYSKFHRNETKDLGLKEWLHFVDGNHEYINSINYGTGENSISDDWFSLIAYIRTKYPEIRQALTTNGYTSEVIQRDSDKKKILLPAIDEIDISLDYADKKKHNEFRGQEHAFEWAIQMLKICKDENIQATIVCLGSARNMYTDNLEGIFKIAKEYNALVRINLYRPTEGINEFTKQFILSPEKLLNILYWIDRNHHILSISDALLSNLVTNSFEEDPSGIDSIRILPDGSITPSTYLIEKNFIVGNILEKEVMKRLTKEMPMRAIIFDCIPEECKHCKYVQLCKGGVYDRRYIWNKTLSKKDPYCIYTPGGEDFNKIEITDAKFNSVHHGYLPTMFFEP